MWNPIKAVANARFLDEAKLEAFAEQAEAQQKFGLIRVGSSLEVNTWHVDAFVKAYKATQVPAVLEADRQAAIARLRTVTPESVPVLP